MQMPNTMPPNAEKTIDLPSMPLGTKIFIIFFIVVIVVLCIVLLAVFLKRENEKENRNKLEKELAELKEKQRLLNMTTQVTSTRPISSSNSGSQSASPSPSSSSLFNVNMGSRLNGPGTSIQTRNATYENISTFQSNTNEKEITTKQVYYSS